MIYTAPFIVSVSTRNWAVSIKKNTPINELKKKIQAKLGNHHRVFERPTPVIFEIYIIEIILTGGCVKKKLHRYVY